MLHTSSEVLELRDLNERYESRRLLPPSVSAAAFVVIVDDEFPVIASVPPMSAFCPTLRPV